jgi:hypothetical protein
VFARAGLGGFLTVLEIFLEELHEPVDQPAAAANHVQPAFMLMFLQNVIDFVFQFRHWKTPALDSPSVSRRAKPQAAISTLTSRGGEQILEILMNGIRKMNRGTHRWVVVGRWPLLAESFVYGLAHTPSTRRVSRSTALTSFFRAA